MDSMIKEINDNLKVILDNLKDNRDTYVNDLSNLQNQMDKKVEEAKKYKIQVDSSKDKIRELESDNESLENSLNEHMLNIFYKVVRSFVRVRGNIFHFCPVQMRKDIHKQ